MLLLVLGANNKTFAQTKEQVAEISTSVPELAGFHTIIYPMWHKAYPAKDIATLKSFVPQIKANMEKINSAKLPGILRERESQWKDQLVKFNAVAETYYKASAGNDTTAILSAAEQFHKTYEAMNRVVKPFIPEMDTYHATLYVIYHKSLPAKDYTAIAAVMDKFISEADAITKYPEDKITKRLKDKAPKFYTVSKELYTATVALKEVLNGKDVKLKDAAIEKAHSTYQKLESVFE